MVGGPGARSEIAGISQHYQKQHGKLLARSGGEDEGDICLGAALSNAVQRLVGGEVAKGVWQYF